MKSILFNAEMVRAILDNRKTVTRRVVKPQPVWDGNFWNVGTNGCGWGKDIKQIRFDSRHTMEGMKQPYLSGDILYVRETFCKCCLTENYRKGHSDYCYKASIESPVYGCVDCYTEGHKCKWRPSIHMPREAARIFLQVTDVRVERLQDITEEQAEAEGCRKWYVGTKSESPARSEFCKVWDSTIKKADRALYGWEANPWVWVIGFERIRKEDAR